ncbi:MAG TPA: cytochrome P450, partial [Nitrococcus sp.]|nr:cytochrome P450 [Nitrococcus sp.]
MAEIPRDKSPESTLALAREGYMFIPNRCRRFRSDLFQARLLLQNTICMSGEETARLFYDPERFQREGAAPRRLQKTLFGQKGVQSLDDEAHRRRKQMFMSLMAPERIAQLAQLTAERWRASIDHWSRVGQIVLFHELQNILCHTVCAWAGIALGESELTARTRDMAAMIDGSGAMGARHWRGRIARRMAEQWARHQIAKARTRNGESVPERAVDVIAWHRNAQGERLDEHTAAVELLNVLRPTVAIARYITFMALALHYHPQYRHQLQASEDAEREWFVQEVRRFYPFFPFAMARVRDQFEWHGFRFPKGERVMLDLYGTNHDARLWEHPDEFRPERFRHWSENAFAFIPQGGGD